MNNFVKLFALIKNIGSFEWARDTSSIYFISNLNGTRDIWKIFLLNSSLKKITGIEGNVVNIKVSPCGKDIAFFLQIPVWEMNGMSFL